MIIKLKPQDHLWSKEGTHVCDERGIARLVSEEVEVEVSEEKAEFVLGIIRAARLERGCDPDTGLPLPPPTDTTESTEETIN